MILKNYRQKLDTAKYAVVACMLLTLAIAWLQKPAPHNPLQALMQRLDYLLYDTRFAALPLPKSEYTDQIAIIDIDERSLRDIGRFPWSRRTIAQLIEKLNAAQVTTITFDVMFSEPETNMALALSAQAKNASLRAQLQKMAPDFDFDAQLANTITQRGDVILGYAFNDENITAHTLPVSTIDLGELRAEQLLTDTYAGYTGNLPALQHAAAGNGYINGNPDIDGSIRRAPLMLRYDNQVYASLALQTALTYLGIDSIAPVAITQDGISHIQGFQLTDKLLRTDKKGQLLIPYRGPQKTFMYVSAADVLQDKLMPNQLTGKMVFVGTSAVGLKDLRSTPVGINYPGVEAQATLLDAMLTGITPYQPDWSVALNILLILLLGFLFCLIMPACGPLWMTTLGLGSAIGIITLNCYLWRYQYIDLPASGPLLTIMLVYGINLSYGFFSTSKQKTQIKSMFGQYVAPAHIDNLLQDTSALSFDGEAKEMTVLFTDIRNFTNASEKLTPNQLKDMLNRYLTPMTEIIFEQQGTIDKYVGDMIMAFWGAPLPDARQKEHAVVTALQMLSRLHTLRAEFATLGYPEIHIGIGINTGMMNVGDMGSVYRRAYTVLGDAVNLGSRLESITKFYGVECLVSETTHQGLEHQFAFREIDYIQVKGKKEAIRVYQPLSDASAALASLPLYQQARTAYINRRWAEARELFTQLHRQDTASEKLYTIYLNRIHQYELDEPSEDWCGIWKHDEK